MINWILDNKQWLFSGVGVTAILLIGGFLRRHFRKNDQARILPEKLPLQVILQSPATTMPAPATVKTDTPLTPRQIEDSIDAVPLLQQSDIIQHYIGIKVSWEGLLADAYKIGDDRVRLMLNPRDKVIMLAIIFSVKPSDYPGLGLLKRGHIIRVRGIIKTIDTTHVMLSDAQIEFDVGA